jgi:hypothetical protein
LSKLPKQLVMVLWSKLYILLWLDFSLAVYFVIRIIITGWFVGVCFLTCDVIEKLGEIRVGGYWRESSGVVVETWLRIISFDGKR